MNMTTETETADWLPTRRSLLTRLRQADDHAGWQEFFDTYWRLLYGVARKAGLSEAEAQDAVQDCVITVSQQMPKFRYEPERCSFKGWLLMILRQRIGRQFQKRMRAGANGEVNFTCPPPADEGMETNAIARVPDCSEDRLEAIWEEEWQRHVLARATERVKAHVSDAQFQIFDLHVLQNWPASDVTKTLGVSIAQVYLAKLRVGRRFKLEVEALKASDAAGEPSGIAKP
ncbi:MAG: sigma-70 family RNA polymerase sigma factor [Verrucomicrobia bacterium]|nr:sigma-70 family RNA polymerase sigma factor [Verrucomicrobiota bacterium]